MLYMSWVISRSMISGSDVDNGGGHSGRSRTTSFALKHFFQVGAILGMDVVDLLVDFEVVQLEILCGK